VLRRRALRHAFTILSALSLLLCVAACVLWVRSMSEADGFDAHWDDSNYSNLTGRSDSGGIELSLKVWEPEPSTRAPLDGRRYVAPRYDTGSRASRFRLGIINMDHYAGEGNLTVVEGDRYLELELPHWASVAATGALPTWFTLLYVRRKRRRTSGSCRACGYDLRASPDRCPECGNSARSAT
jgi:hypothetical protein